MTLPPGQAAFEGGEGRAQFEGFFESLFPLIGPAGPRDAEEGEARKAAAQEVEGRFIAREEVVVGDAAEMGPHVGAGYIDDGQAEVGESVRGLGILDAGDDAVALPGA